MTLTFASDLASGVILSPSTSSTGTSSMLPSLSALMRSRSRWCRPRPSPADHRRAQLRKPLLVPIRLGSRRLHAGYGHCLMGMSLRGTPAGTEGRHCQKTVRAHRDKRRHQRSSLPDDRCAPVKRASPGASRGAARRIGGMTVLIDTPLWPTHGTVWSHLVSDASLAELHAFAERTGVPARAFDLDHYDVPGRALRRAGRRRRRTGVPRELVRRLAAQRAAGHSARAARPVSARRLTRAASAVVPSARVITGGAAGRTQRGGVTRRLRARPWPGCFGSGSASSTESRSSSASSGAPCACARRVRPGDVEERHAGRRLGCRGDGLGGAGLALGPLGGGRLRPRSSRPVPARWVTRR